MTTPTPTNVAATAQIDAALPLHQTTLIGIFSNGTGGTALLRSARGDIIRVTTGDTALGMTVTALDGATLHYMAADGTPQTLTIPGAP